MNLYFYTSNSGKNLIYEYFDSLPEDERIDGYSVVENIQNGELDKIQYKQWMKKVYEVYFYKHNRIFYVVANGDDIYLLHCCKKQKNKTEKKDAQMVKKRAKEIGKILNKKFI